MGQDLIKGATARAQISQIDKYNSAVNTFYGKYGFLPGDIPDPNASRFGFAARGPYPGTGDGNGILQGYPECPPPGCNAWGFLDGAGETVMFWVDLSAAKMIDAGLSTASSTTLAGSDVTANAIGQYLPQAKMGAGNYVYVWNTTTSTPEFSYNPYPDNWFGVAQVNGIYSSSNYGKIGSLANISPIQAYNIDKKMDDGYPMTGTVVAVLMAENGDCPMWADGTLTIYSPPPTGPITGSATTCFDDGGNTANAMQYSVSQNGGTSPTCALSFRMTGAGR